jgi:hypothetical protein
LEEVDKETHWDKHPRRSHTDCNKIVSHAGELIFKGIETVLLADYKHEALTGR